MKTNATTREREISTGPGGSFKQVMNGPQPKGPAGAASAAAAATSRATPVPSASTAARATRATPVPAAGLGVGASSTEVLVSTKQAHVQVQQTFGQARTHADSEAGRLDTVRGQGEAVSSQQTAVRAELNASQRAQASERAVELIRQELVAAFSGTPSRAANDARKTPPGPYRPPPTPALDRLGATAPTPGGPGGQSEPVADPQTKAAQAVALIEKIETFVKGAQRPALALTLNNSLGARVEIERIGPQQVALKLVGRNGPPSPEAVSRIRDELTARGLKVAALSVA